MLALWSEFGSDPNSILLNNLIMLEIIFDCLVEFCSSSTNSEFFKTWDFLFLFHFFVSSFRWSSYSWLNFGCLPESRNPFVSFLISQLNRVQLLKIVSCILNFFSSCCNIYLFISKSVNFYVLFILVNWVSQSCLSSQKIRNWIHWIFIFFFLFSVLMIVL